MNHFERFGYEKINKSLREYIFGFIENQKK